MQRKNYLLKSSRDGMAMIMAIAVIVILSTIMALSLSMTMQTSKRTTDIYLYEESRFLAQSATEYALLQIAQNPPCTYTGGSFTQNKIYDINISVKYVYSNDYDCKYSYTTVQTKEQNGSALIDISVATKPDVATEPIHFFRRTIEKL
ncbi:hypothetical protein MNB_SM-3-1371 [hydrothermal vent metagenome]|uniref:Type II secretion system protein n=1 Tax=hydrothermal vent metagenome TaxID=652676 RepID=A0A1W1D1G4_9ZZZZ